MNQYETLSKADLITKLKPMFDKGALHLRNDGKIDQDTRLTYNSPWIHQRIAPNRNCGLYHIYYNHFGFIHSRCQECWKVVVRPRTLSELDKLRQIQKKLDTPSKCGIEKRDTVCGLYGGYFYNDSLEKGRDCYKLVRATISPEITVLLKRGCTEFEIGGEPSDLWEVTEDQKELEEYLNDWVVSNVEKLPQPDHLKDTVFRSWIHWAYQHGDMTYLDYTDGKPLFPPYKTYHEVEDGKEEETHSLGSPERTNKTVIPVWDEAA